MPVLCVFVCVTVFQRESKAAANNASGGGAAAAGADAALTTSASSGKKGPDVVHSAAMARSLKIMERMVSQVGVRPRLQSAPCCAWPPPFMLTPFPAHPLQNAEDEIYNDFKFWEDASDQFREGEGSLLPLWRFADARTRRKQVCVRSLCLRPVYTSPSSFSVLAQVTALAWNPRYPDLFAVGYGTYDFMKQVCGLHAVASVTQVHSTPRACMRLLPQGSGLVCVFSLKNASHPEYTFTTESGVMCLDFHPQVCWRRLT